MFEALLQSKIIVEPVGEQVFAPGIIHSFTVPPNVKQISGITVGCGQNGIGGQGGNNTVGGNGGSTRWIRSFRVTPGEALTIYAGVNGEDSFIRRSNGQMVLIAKGGATSTVSTPINLPEVGGGDGGLGGQGSAQNAGAGGGAGGYSGNGGNGFPQFTPGEGGAGAGGIGATSSNSLGFMGGGVGIYGEGPSGINPGQGGSGGTDGTFVNAGGYGSGAGTRWSGNNQTDYWYAFNGVVRLIWGPGRAFPNNAEAVS